MSVAAWKISTLDGIPVAGIGTVAGERAKHCPVIR